jgi:hypothetical protein
MNFWKAVPYFSVRILSKGQIALGHGLEVVDVLHWDSSVSKIFIGRI